MLFFAHKKLANFECRFNGKGSQTLRTGMGLVSLESLWWNLNLNFPAGWSRLDAVVKNVFGETRFSSWVDG
jgi:hypothetical protein